MKIFKKKDKIEKLNMELEENKRDNKEYEEYMDKEKEDWLENRDKTKTEKISKVAKGIGAGIGTFLMFAGLGMLSIFAAMLDSGEGTDNTSKDWREDDDLFNDIDYSEDSEDAHSQVQIALDMTNLDDEKDCVKTYLWMYKNIDNMPKTVKTVIGMTKGQIDSDHLARPQTEVYAWYSREKEVAQKAMKQLKKYYSNVNKNDKIIILKGE